MFRIAQRHAVARIPRRNFSGLTIKSEATTPMATVPANFEPPQPKVEVPKPQPKLQKVVSAWRIRTLWFAVGVSTAGLVGYMKLVDEVRQANTDLKVRLQGAHSDVTLLHARLKEVEQRLAQVEQHSTFDPPKKEVKIVTV